MLPNLFHVRFSVFSLKTFLKRLPTSQKFNTDVLWNVVSVAIMGVSGAGLTLIIAKLYGPTALGLFNLTYAIFAFLSQLVAAGIHLSILNSVARYVDDEEEVKNILSAGFLTAGLTSLFFLTVIYVAKDLFAIIFRSPTIVTSLVCVIPGLFFFTLNKIFLSFHNACRRMKTYAVFQALRYVFLILALVCLVSFSVAAERLSLIFTLSELVLTFILISYSFRHIRFSFSKRLILWAKQHLSFGFKAAFGNLLTMANIRTDVMVLGMFVPYQTVGIYSFAVFLVDGFNQLVVVIRTNVNPLLTQYRFKRGVEDLRKAVSQGKNLFYKMMIPIGILLVAVFPLIIWLFRLNSDFYKGLPSFAILMAGSLISVGYKPFLMILNQTDYPGHQSILMSLIFGTNVLLNFILIPFFGMIGAAVGTAISTASMVLFLKLLVMKTMGIRI